MGGGGGGSKPNGFGVIYTVSIYFFGDFQVAPKRWRLEINFSQDAVLMLSSMNMPDGIQVTCISLVAVPFDTPVDFILNSAENM